MAYANKYKIGFRNPAEELFYLYILEDGFAGDVTELKGTASPCVYRIIDNDENPYKFIQGSELTISFYDEGEFDFFTFIQTATTDTFYKVEVYSTSHLVWTGFLDLESCNEQIIDPPKVVVLRAVDGLGFLKNETFSDHDGAFQYGKYTLLQLIEWCLNKTGLQLDLYSAVNVFEDSMDDKDDDPDAIPFDQCKVHTRYLENSNCYDVLAAICTTFSASLYQYNGGWWIDRKHDRWNDRYHGITIIDYPYTSGARNTVDYTYRPSAFTPVNADHLRFFVSPYKSVTTTYNFVAPDIPRNKNFTGNFLAPVSGPTNTANRIDYWAYEYGSVSSPTTSGAIPYRNQVYDSSGQKIIDTYIVLPRDSPTVVTDERLICESIEVSEGDKVVLSFEHRFKFDVSGAGNAFMAQLILYGDSGQKYTLDESTLDLNDQGTWTATLTSATGQVIQRSYGSGDDLTEWLNFSITTQGLPEDGLLALWLYEGTPSVNGNESWFRNVRLELQFFVNDRLGIIGERASNSNDATYRPVSDNIITMGDAPKKLINGALFRATDDTELTELWYQQGYSETGKKLITLANRAIFQLGYRYKTKVEGTVYGITWPNPEDVTELAVFGPGIEMIYEPVSMENLKYIPTNLTMDIAAGTAQVFLMEFYNDTEEDNPIGDSETLTYLYQ